MGGIGSDNAFDLFARWALDIFYALYSTGFLSLYSDLTKKSLKTPTKQVP